jgi:hypothetical protein
MEVWDFRGSKLFNDKGVILMEELSSDMYPVKMEAGKISHSERQWIQIEKAVHNDNSIYVQIENLKREMELWAPPFHFIDFETSMVAIPFNTNRKPYEQVAFQFSHHRVEKDGTIVHANEYINTTPGEFPNFKFVRALKVALGESGTIFRYSNHENTVLNQIRVQLKESLEIDKEELIQFIESITKRKGDKHIGKRCMIDLCEVYKNFYYDPETKGSNSIKSVLPVMLKRSQCLQKKYSNPLSEINVSSKNFPDAHTWLLVKGGVLQDPYKILPPVFEDWSNDELDRFSGIEELNNGGAALTAYGFMQYTDMSAVEREALTKSLKKYCELDTLAMVMIWEGFHEIAENNKR